MSQAAETARQTAQPAQRQPMEPVPLLPRTRMIGSMLGAYTSIRRGQGSDVAGSRPYRPGDHARTIDWKASARLSSVTGDDEFIVRERYAHEMPRVVILCDRRPEMALYPEELPWLSKPLAVERIVELVVVSALNQRGLVGYLDHASHGAENDAGTPFWRPPRAHGGSWGEGNLVEQLETHLRGGLDAPSDTLDQGLRFLSVVAAAVPIGSFVFVVSDFLEPPPRESWAAAIDRGWDLVAVVVQDPVWEQSFPPIGGVVTPFVAADGGALQYVRLTEAEAAERRTLNIDRLARLESDLLELGVDPILVSSEQPEVVQSAFLEWSEHRLTARGLL